MSVQLLSSPVWTRGSASEPVPAPKGPLPKALLRLSYPVKPNDHAALHTVDDASAYLDLLRQQTPTIEACECAANLALKLPDSPTEAAVAELTRHLELALLVAQRLDSVLEIARPTVSVTHHDRSDGEAPLEEGGMKRLLSVLLSALLVACGVWVISNHYGGGVQTFAERWCALIGVSDPLSVHVAAGIFSGGALIVIIYLCYAVVAQVFWALFAGWRRQ